jgi:hypothetical protein
MHAEISGIWACAAMERQSQAGQGKFRTNLLTPVVGDARNNQNDAHDCTHPWLLSAEGVCSSAHMCTACKFQDG